MMMFERIRALYDRIDGILETVPDNPIYQDHESRALLNYAQTIRILESLPDDAEIRNEDRKERMNESF